MHEDERWVAVGSFPFRQAADVLASVLDGHGIPARVTGDDAGGIAPYIGFGTGFPEVEVPEDRLEEARALIESDVTTDGDASGDEDPSPVGDL